MLRYQIRNHNFSSQSNRIEMEISDSHKMIFPASCIQLMHASDKTKCANSKYSTKAHNADATCWLVLVAVTQVISLCKVWQQLIIVLRFTSCSQMPNKPSQCHIQWITTEVKEFKKLLTNQLRKTISKQNMQMNIKYNFTLLDIIMKLLSQ